MTKAHMPAWRRFVLGGFTWRRLLRAAGSIYLGLLLFGWLGSDRLIFRPPPPSYHAGGGYYRVPTAGGAQIGMLALTNPASRCTILYAHGNGDDLGGLRAWLEEYSGHGFDVYAFDYRGYGISDGRPGTRGALEDGEAALRHLVEDRHIPLSRIILHGHSLGAAIALDLAARHAVAGLIVESGFLTAFRCRTQIPIVPFDKLRNNRRIREIKCPVLVMHGEQDTLIPCWQGRELFRLAPEPKRAYWAPDAGHNDLPDTNPLEYWKHVLAFVALVEAPHPECTSH